MKLDDFARSTNGMGYIPEHVRVFSGRSNIGRREGTVTGAEGFYGPPFAAGKLSLCIGLEIVSHHCTVSDAALPGHGNPIQLLLQSENWHPSYIKRTGIVYQYLGEGLYLNISVDTWLIPSAIDDSFYLKMIFKNRDGAPLTMRAIPMWNHLSFRVPKPTDWQWAPPSGGGPAQKIRAGVYKGENAFLKTFWSGGTGIADGITATIGANSECEVILKVLFQKEDLPVNVIRPLTAEIEASLNRCEERWEELWNRCPHLETSHEKLRRAYNHSILSYYLCRWDSPHLLHTPYLSESGIDGGAVCNYLWGSQNCAKMRALCEGELLKPTILAYFNMDINAHYALEPLTGKGIGPCYSYNCISLVYLVEQYVAYTADEAFLTQDVNGMPLYLRLREMIEKFESQFDAYGELLDFGSHHNLLEMRTSGYEHVVFSPNGERVGMYAFLSRVFSKFGHNEESLRYHEKSEAIKKEMQSKLWDHEHQWMACLYPDGHKEFVYSVQMFDLINTGILSKEQEASVIRRVNQDEFLSSCGVHSVSKRDLLHFDLGDIDWSGGGCYAADPCNLIETLFLAGEKEKAWEVIESILWWSDRYPYWPQTIFADRQDYGHYYERANIVTAFAFAQAIVFGMFGLHGSTGSWALSENLPDAVQDAKLTNIDAV